ncbi:hypothetical protein M427DRAFT_50625 [Gonapodya prolifera JEL478]|uniref:HIG1 domain-containing protein n=1 Tax=Gonapodya prolifera (strain JEL478) TaxID=1344416 RepID=A0A139AZX3_GONPJ|nr:hypothetical protein M427DRAFT_50625 [Gonapodya prolifera JEL478]|eukprot:KXS22292.1 hypothetical protein M427DRAFT_50625 [Gonapodya prolifera JEL478]
MTTIEQAVVSDIVMGGQYGQAANAARSKQEKDMIHKYTIEQAMKGGFYGTIFGVGFHLIATRYWPRYARFHYTPKWIFTLIWPIAGFTIYGEQSALDLERKIAARKSVVDLGALATPKPDAADTLTSFSWLPTPTEVQKYVLDNRYKVVGMGWLTVTSLTLAALWANKGMPVSQKLIHARMYAQGTALASFVAFAFAANVPVDRSSEMDRMSERYFRAVLEQRDVSGEELKKRHAEEHKVHSISDAGVMVRGG